MEGWRGCRKKSRGPLGVVAGLPGPCWLRPPPLPCGPQGLGLWPDSSCAGRQDSSLCGEGKQSVGVCTQV